MKKTLHINLAGFAFNIDEDAFKALEAYLTKVENSFVDKKEAEEIVADIEGRFAELFQNKSISGRVISLSEVEEVIKTMGEPQEFADEAEEHAETQVNEEPSITYKKRLYRDTDNKVFGGVCGGLGAYFNMDPLVFRVIFFIAFILYGASLPIYLILWIVMPKALTLTQRMEMKGPSDYENWEQNIRNEYNDVSTRFKQSKAYENVNSGMGKANDVMGIALRKIINFFVITLGVALMISSIVGIIGIVVTAVFGYSFIDFSGVGNYITTIPSLFMDGHQFSYASIGIILLAVMPLLILFFLGFKLTFKVKNKIRYVVLGALLFWLLGIAIVVFSAGKVAKSYSTSQKVLSEDRLPLPSGNTLYIKPNNKMNFPEDKEHLFEMNQLEIFSSQNEILVKGTPKIELIEGDEFNISINREARGGDMKEAITNAEGIEFFWILKDSVLYIDPAFTLQDGIKLKDQQLDVTISIPSDLEVEVDGNLAWSIYNNLD